MPHQVHEATHRIVFGREVGMPAPLRRSLIFASAPTHTASTGLARPLMLVRYSFASHR